jgi:hypothetical protein
MEVQHIAARAEVTRRACADVRPPDAGNRGPIKSLAPILGGEKAYASGTALQNVEDRRAARGDDRGRRCEESHLVERRRLCSRPRSPLESVLTVANLDEPKGMQVEQTMDHSIRRSTVENRVIPVDGGEH